MPTTPVSSRSSKPSLLNIPREIRDVIYIEVLKSPTGRVTFLPADIHASNYTCYRLKVVQVDEEDNKIIGFASVAFLRTCKQIHSEYSDLFWRLNTIVIWPDVLFTDWKQFRIQDHLKFQHVALKLDLISPDKWGAVALLKLGEWAKRGCLKGVEVGLENPQCVGLLYKDETAKKAFENHLKVLRELGGSGGDLAEVERKIVLDTKKQNRIAPSLKWIDDLEVVLGHVHEDFGGELWIDEQLRYAKREKCLDSKVGGQLDLI